MKKILFGSCLFLFSWAVFAQERNIDPDAVLILDRMSDVIGDLESVSFKLSSNYDAIDHAETRSKKHYLSDVYMVGPDKMMINTEGDKGHRQYFYNGNTLTYYSQDENNYGTIETPSNILQTIDSVYNAYAIDFPASDFFYPTFTDDMIENSSEISYLGNTEINGVECYHIQSVGKEINVQIWISNDGLSLPLKYLIVYNQLKGNPQYEATFTDWQINPTLPVSIFEFAPPTDASLLRIISKNEQE